MLAALIASGPSSPCVASATGSALASAEVELFGPDGQATIADMAVAVKRLDVDVGDLVEIDGRIYDVVSDKAGGVTLEPAITVFSPELHQRHGTRPISQEEFRRALR